MEEFDAYGKIFVLYEVEEYVHDTLVTYNDGEEHDGDTMHAYSYPHVIRFDKDSIWHLSDLGILFGERFQGEKNFRLHYDARKYCLEHKFHPWIKLAYHVDASTGVMEVERNEWPGQHNEIVYKLKKFTPEEIIISSSYQDNKDHYYLMYYYQKYRWLPSPISELTFCCYDSLYCYINKIKPLTTGLGRPVGHDHNNIDINRLDF